MKHRPAAFLSLLTVLLGSSYVAYAALGGPSGVNIPFQGRLENNGLPVDGDVDLIFSVFNQAADGAACFTAAPTPTTVSSGAFHAMVGPVPEPCVRGEDVWLEIAVDDGAGAVTLAGRQRVYPAVAAATSGAGDFDVAGALDVAGATTTSSLTVTGASALAASSVTGAMSLFPPALIAMNDRPLHLRSAADDNHKLQFGSSFGGVAFNGPQLTGFSGGVLGTTSGGEKTALEWSAANKQVTIHGPATIAADVSQIGTTGKSVGLYGGFGGTRGIGVGGTGTSDEVWMSSNFAFSWFQARTDSAEGTKNMYLGAFGELRTRSSVTANVAPDIAETIPAAADVAAADVVCADPRATERAVKCAPGARAPLGVISDGSSSFLINAHGGSVDAPLTGKPLVLAGRVPVKISLENGPIVAGDVLVVSARTPGVATKSRGQGAIVGVALASAGAGAGTVLAFIKVGDYHAADAAAQIADLSQRLDAQRAINDALERRLAAMETMIAQLAPTAATGAKAAALATGAP